MDEYCTTPGSNVVSDTIRSWYCGLATAWSVPVGGLTGIAGEVGQTAESISENVGGTVEGVAEDVTEAANPLNLFGAGLGISLGGVLAVTGVGLVGALLVDQLVFAGAGTTALLARGRRRR